jgi:hypothetical protein
MPEPKMGTPQGDFGIGLCLACCNLHRQGQPGETFPAFAVTMAPTFVPVPGPPGSGVIVAVPSCYEHATAGADPEAARQAQKRPLLVAGGALNA